MVDIYQYDTVAKNTDVMITLPAHLVYQLNAVAGGYTQMNGHWLDRNAIMREVRDRLYYDCDYETYYPTMLAGHWEGNEHTIVPREELTYDA